MMILVKIGEPRERAISVASTNQAFCASSRIVSLILSREDTAPPHGHRRGIDGPGIDHRRGGGVPVLGDDPQRLDGLEGHEDIGLPLGDQGLNWESLEMRR